MEKSIIRAKCFSECLNMSRDYSNRQVRNMQLGTKTSNTEQIGDLLQKAATQMCV